MSLGKIAKQVVGAVAPTIATALGGPFAGVAMKFLADKLGIDETGEVEEFLVAAGNDPDKLLALKQADQDFKVKLRELDIKEYELDVRDRDSARELGEKKGLHAQHTLSGVYSVGYFGIFGLILTGVVSEQILQLSVVSALVGALTAAQLQIMNFWFGSSRGSKDKTEAMARIIADPSR